MKAKHPDNGECAVILTVDAESYALATIDLAVAMAVSIKTGLHGLFIEDEDLLRIAELPFTREIAFPTARERSTDALIMQRFMRAMAGQFRKYLAQSAQTSQIQWSYDYVCGRARDIGLESDQNTTYTIVGHSVFRQPESTYSLRRRKVLLIENHSPHILNALQVVINLLANKKVEVTVIKNCDNAETSAAIILQHAFASGSKISVSELEHDQLPEVLSGAGSIFDYVIVSRQEPIERLREILARSLCPVILVS